MEQTPLQQIYAWLSRPDNYGVLLSVVLPLALVFVIFWFAQRSRQSAALNAIQFLCFDADRRFVHIVGAHTYMPDDGDSFDVYHHRLLDRNDGKIYQGGHQRGAHIHVDSNFILRTTAALESLVGQKLKIVEQGSFGMDSESGGVSKRPVCIEKPPFESNTERATAPPRFGVVFRQADSERDKFSFEAYAGGERTSWRNLSGSISAFKGLYDEQKNELLFVYAHGMFYRLGICIVDMNSGAVKLQKLIKPD